MAIQFLNTGYFPDNAKLTFGDATTPDLEIYHDGTHSYIDDVGTGSLYIKGGSSVQIESNTGENMIVCSTNAAVELYYDNALKLGTTNTGVSITGNINTSTDSSVFTGDGSTGVPLFLRSTGNVSYLQIQNSSTGTTGANDGLTVGCNGTAGYIWLREAASLNIGTNDTSAITIDSSQNSTFAGDVSVGDDLNIAGNELTFTNDAASAYIRAADALLIQSDWNTGENKPIYLQPSAVTELTIATGLSTFAGDVLVPSGYVGRDSHNRVDFQTDDSIIIRVADTYRGRWDSTGLNPYGDSLYDLGQTGKRWANIWVDSINGGAVLTVDHILPLAGGTMTGNVIFNDNIRIKLGTGGGNSDIYHNGTDMYIRNLTTAGDMSFASDSTGSGGSATAYFFLDGGVVKTRFAKGVNFEDNVKATFGNVVTPDLEIYSDGTNGIINNIAGSLYIMQNTDDEDIQIQCDNGSGGLSTYMLFDGSQTNIHTQVDFRIYDSKKLQLGNGADFEAFHDGSHLYMGNYTGDWYITNYADDKDIIFKSDDGLGGTTEYFRLDGSSVLNVFTKPARWEDGVQAQFGGGNDLRIQHDGTDSLIDNYTGHLYIRQQTDNADIIFQADDSLGGVETYFYLDGSSASYPHTVWPTDSRIQVGTGLYFYGNGTNSYIDNWSGDLTISNNANDKDIIFQSDDGSGGIETYFYLDGSANRNVSNKNFRIIDNKKLTLGSSDDLEIYHDGTDSYINNNTGILNITNNDIRFKTTGAETMLRAVANGAVELMYDNSTKIATTSAGATITGALSITGDGSNAATLTESGTGDFTIDAVGDIKFDADGGDWYFKDGGTNILQLTAGGSSSPTFSASQLNADIIFKGNDGGVTITALTLDISDSGTAIFNHHLSIPDYITHYQDASTRFGFSGPSTFVVNTGGTTALTIDSSQDATFTGDISAVALTLSGKGTSAATVDGDGSTTMATKGWVESKLTGATLYQGTWDPDVSLNSGYGNPDLSTAALQVNGYYYICSADGTAEPNGTGTEPDSWHTGDWVIWNDDVGVSGEWQKIDNTTVLSGAGTGEYLAKWTDTETLGDSIVLTSGSDIIIPQYIQHTGDLTSYFGFSATNTYKLTMGGSDRLQITGDVHVVGSTDFAIPAGRKFYLDGQSNTYITESSDGVIDFYGDGTFLVSMKQNGTQSEVVVNEGSGDVDFRVEANTEDHAFFVDAEASGAVAVGGSNITYKFNVHEGDMFVGATSAVGGRGIYFKRTSATNTWSLLQGHNGTNAFELREGSDTRMYWDDGGNVGVGTIAPDAKLSVTSTGIASEDVLYLKSGADNANEYLGIVFETGGGGNGPHAGIRVYNGPSSSDAYMSLLTTTDGGTLTQGLTQDHLGNIGIGTTSPNEKLHVYGGHLEVQNAGNTNIYINAQANSDATLYFQEANSAKAKIQHDASNDSVLFTDGAYVDTMTLKGAQVGIGTTAPDAKLDVNGGIIAGGKTTYTISSASLTTTGTAVAGLSTGTNLQSSGFIFTCFGGDGYQRIVYSCRNESGTWNIDKDIDEGVNAFDVTYAADGSDNITFTFKSRSGTQSYTPKVTVEAVGDQINQSYIN